MAERHAGLVEGANELKGTDQRGVVLPFAGSVFGQRSGGTALAKGLAVHRLVNGAG